ncbi:hypothetical protein pb186bvf_011109 [Paramecium bursaria]
MTHQQQHEIKQISYIFMPLNLQTYFQIYHNIISLLFSIFNLILFYRTELNILIIKR